MRREKIIEITKTAAVVAVAIAAIGIIAYIQPEREPDRLKIHASVKFAEDLNPNKKELLVSPEAKGLPPDLKQQVQAIEKQAEDLRQRNRSHYLLIKNTGSAHSGGWINASVTIFTNLPSCEEAASAVAAVCSGKLDNSEVDRSLRRCEPVCRPVLQSESKE